MVVLTLSRRAFLRLVPVAAAAVAFPRRVVARMAGSPGHPDPRPGITAAKVLKAAQIRHEGASPVFDQVREIPRIIDGIRCYCGCADNPDHYSLLSCFEGEGMAQHCAVCQGEARLAHRLHRDGWSLAGIRASIDAQFGDS
jgi:hypothetical protein